MSKNTHRVRDAAVAGGLTMAALTGAAGCGDVKDAWEDYSGNCPPAPAGVKAGNVDTFLRSNPDFIQPEQLGELVDTFKGGNNDQYIYGQGGAGDGILPLLDRAVAEIEQKMPVDGDKLAIYTEASNVVRAAMAMQDAKDGAFIHVEAPCSSKGQLVVTSTRGHIGNAINFSTTSFTKTGMRELFGKVEHTSRGNAPVTTALSTYANLVEGTVALMGQAKPAALEGEGTYKHTTHVARYQRALAAHISPLPASATERLAHRRETGAGVKAGI